MNKTIFIFGIVFLFVGSIVFAASIFDNPFISIFDKKDAKDRIKSITKETIGKGNDKYDKSIIVMNDTDQITPTDLLEIQTESIKKNGKTRDIKVTH